MPQFFLNKRLIILLVSIIILVALIGFSMSEREELSWPEQFLKDTTGWVQNIFSKPQQFVAGFFEDVRDLQNTYTENKELKSRLDELAKLKADVEQLKKENQELREVIDAETSLRDYEPIHATVIGRNPDQWNELLIINKGEVNGIEQNMAVVTSSGLIGKVKSVQQFTSTIQLLSSMDPANRISAEIDGDETIYGTIEGYDQDRDLLRLKRIPHDVKIEKGQLVVTSGLGGVFPEGLPIGKIVDSEPDEQGLTQVAYVEPGADFYDIKQVLVVKRVAMQPNFNELSEEEDK